MAAVQTAMLRANALHTVARRDLPAPDNLGGTRISPVPGPRFRRRTLSAGLLAVVRVSDRIAELPIGLAQLNTTSRVHSFDRADWHREVTGILDIDHELWPPTRRNLANRAELLATIRNNAWKPTLIFSCMRVPAYFP